jgi:hypothetical protein
MSGYFSKTSAKQPSLSVIFASSISLSTSSFPLAHRSVGSKFINRLALSLNVPLPVFLHLISSFIDSFISFGITESCKPFFFGVRLVTKRQGRLQLVLFQ